MAQSFLLYYITDRTALAPDEPTRRRRLLEKISEAILNGVDYIQLREKDRTTRELEMLAREIMGLVSEMRTQNRSLGTKLLINSRTDIALAVGADGVHLHGDDISPREVHRVWKQSAARQEPLIGVSCHSVEEVVQAEANGASFAVFAPVFEKRGAPERRATGLDELREACKVEIPVLALGGVTLANARQCRKAGAAGIAAIRLFQENDIASVVAELKVSR